MSLIFKRNFSKDFIPQFDRRDIRIHETDGSVKFEQKDVYIPPEWDENATRIFVSKYFSGHLGTPEREQSIDQSLRRVVDTITGWGIKDGYFDPENGEIFKDELYALIYKQCGTFNSPVWFNIGLSDKPVTSACFINNLDDSLESITDLMRLEVKIFNSGSGSGTNVSKLRSKDERLSGGGYSSGPLSFMKILDKIGGVVKSGGIRRRAAILRTMDIDHPDIVDYIYSKVSEEKKARDLISLGYENSLDGPAYSSLDFQNANHSVMIPNRFMEAVEKDEDWNLINRVDGEVSSTVKARDLLMDIAKATHACGDPGVQFYDHINASNPLKDPIVSSNPCISGSMKLLTDKGYCRFEDLEKEDSIIIVNRLGHKVPSKVWKSGKKPVVEVVFGKKFGLDPIECTGDHVFLLSNGLECEAKDLAHKKVSVFVNFRAIKDEDLFFEGYECEDPSKIKKDPDFICGLSSIDIIFDGILGYLISNKDRNILVKLKRILKDTYKIHSHFIDRGHVNLSTLNINNYRSIIDFSEMIGVSFSSAIRDVRKYFRENPPYVRVVEDLDCIDVYDFNEPELHWGVVNHVIVHNCGEYLGATNSACNLACLNISKFLDSRKDIDWGNLGDAVRIFTTAQDILIDNSSYPSDTIAENSKKYRALGLGITDLGGLFMIKALPYDSDNARNLAADIYSFVTRTAHDQSIELAKIFGNNNSFDLTKILHSYGEKDYLSEGWDILKDKYSKYGSRNSQVSLAAPNGTTGITLGCDSNGIEPVFSLTAYKTLVGGGSMELPCGAAVEALSELGYNSYYRRHFRDSGDLSFLTDDEKPVFDCAMPSKQHNRCLSVDAHLEMLAAIQPFMSGGISKTSNVPNSYTVEDIYNLYVKSWKLGLKSITVYRDGSKAIQPLKSDISNGDLTMPHTNSRKPLPDERPSITHKFIIGEHEGYLTVGLYPDDGRPGELFIRMAKAGSVVSGLVDSAALAISLLFQYGAPLEVVVDKYKHSRFEPSGFTNNDQIRYAKSIMDYIARWLEYKFIIKFEDAPEEAKISQGEVCPSCGSFLVRSGTCYSCPNCGETTGCS